MPPQPTSASDSANSSVKRWFSCGSVLLALLILPSSVAMPSVASEFPNDATAGPFDESKIPGSVGSSITTAFDGQVIENVHTSGMIIRHDNVTVRNFRVTISNPSAHWGINLEKKSDGSWPKGTLIEYGEITSATPSSAVGVRIGRDIVVRYVAISYMSDALHCGGGNCTFVGNFIHHLIPYQGSHNDGIQVSSGSRVVIRHNTILLPDQQTGTVSLFPTSGPIDDVLVENNYLNGGTYTIYSRTKSHGTPTNVRVINNEFGRDYVFGIKSFDGKVVFENNIWADTGLPIDGESGGEITTSADTTTTSSPITTTSSYATTTSSPGATASAPSTTTDIGPPATSTTLALAFAKETPPGSGTHQSSANGVSGPNADSTGIPRVDGSLAGPDMDHDLALDAGSELNVLAKLALALSGIAVFLLASWAMRPSRSRSSTFERR